ncbi:tetratricopeptide repeat protein [Trichlorobacter ammonificans]|uniref:Tetratricopeptide TPR_2 repeat protein n=1 Tax=Trichlorobacter ammonificans TaxID=2916410 RepID=A0ABM9D683_9BACT|nr:tetratricopeptide repeat protein [Trichlorobacter ammonificans]CAH2029921.1 Tetratricopeptide TPR_2 repeat protein [Trichlorobacter ammonificans]
MNSFVVPAASYEAQNAYRRLQLTMEKDDPRMAILEIRTFLKMYPDLALACNDLGVLYAQTGEKLLALACYEKANRLQPATPVIVKNLAEFYFVELGWTDDAILMLTELLKSHPDDTDLLALLGTISGKIGREQEARTFFRRVLELEPGNRDASVALRQLEGAIPAAEFSAQPVRPAAPPVPPPVQAAPVQPVAPPAATAAPAGSPLDDILARLRSTIATAEAVVRPASPAQPTAGMSAEQRYREAQTAVANGDADRAVTLLEQLVAETPVSPLAHNDLGILYTNAGRLDLAVNHHELAVRQAPDNPLFAKNLAALYYSLCGRTDEAIAIYTRLVKEYPTDVEVLTALAIISNNNNLKEQARVFISRVLDFEPWNADARQFLAEL